jgi:transcriptional regulator with XRE-family HTH domain
MSALSDLLNEANSGKLSARSLARAAQAAGFSLNHDTAARYLRGDHGRPDEATLLALSKVLRIPLSRLRAAASLPAGETEPYRPPAESSRLSRRQRRAIDEIIRAMLESAGTGGADELSDRRARRTGTNSGRAAGSPSAKKATRPSRAARRGSTEAPRD